MQSHCMNRSNEYWLIVHLALGKQLRWNSKWDSNLLMEENAFDIVICKTSVVCSGINQHLQRSPIQNLSCMILDIVYHVNEIALIHYTTLHCVHVCSFVGIFGNISIASYSLVSHYQEVVGGILIMRVSYLFLFILLRSSFIMNTIYYHLTGVKRAGTQISTFSLKRFSSLHQI